MTLSNGLILQKLYLRNFRRYEEALFQFEPTLNTIIGPNAFGKTTVLEAIQCLMNGRSFRTHQMGDLLRDGQKKFSIEAYFIKQGIEQNLKFYFDGNERKIIYNSSTLSSATHLLGLIHGVVVTPDHVSLIKGTPVVRRHFLDLQIAQVDPLYVHHLTRYTKAMRQRNVLLKRKELSTIESWETEMAGAAAYITLQRKQAVHDLQKIGLPIHEMLAGEGQALLLDYKSSCSDRTNMGELREHYLQQWGKMRHREKDVGTTLYGPHRDDLLIKIGEREARLFASEGQQRTCVMALKLAEWERLRLISHELPLMLIDDVGVSLDGSRRQKLLMHLNALGQVFLTSTDNL
ncbi:MAG: hypothetical protein BGO14_05765 [Chlamydiales bacterium 38-26]|nr:DNA replication and repair protein RecF [Chlamydiales bacterium]OJV08404.1 MAG: hypothetical protein BGO14_05765 [Chlamydiales bacterium 38-26]